MKRTILFTLVFTAALIGVAYVVQLSRTEDASPAVATDSVHIIASIYSVGHFAEQVGGSDVTVSVITPTGIDAHDFEPTPQDVARIQEADVFVYNGAGIDPWAERLAPELKERGVTVIAMADQIELLPIEETDEHEEEIGHEEEAHAEEEQEHGAYDPHMWLDPVVAQQEVALIRDALIAVDATNAEQYTSRATAYTTQLTELNTRYSTGLQECAVREVVVTHNSLAYLAHRYQFTATPIAGISPDVEPSAQQLAQLANEMQERGITSIIFESLVSEKLANTLSQEVGAQTLLFYTMEGITAEEEARGETYQSFMERNLITLQTAMGCN